MLAPNAMNARELGYASLGMIEGVVWQLNKSPHPLQLAVQYFYQFGLGTLGFIFRERPSVALRLMETYERQNCIMFINNAYNLL